VREQIGVLDKAVAKTGYLVNEQFTFADINLLPILLASGNCRKARRRSPTQTHLARYYDRHAARPSFKRTQPAPPARHAVKKPS